MRYAPALPRLNLSLTHASPTPPSHLRPSLHCSYALLLCLCLCFDTTPPHLRPFLFALLLCLCLCFETTTPHLCPSLDCSYALLLCICLCFETTPSHHCPSLDCSFALILCYGSRSQMSDLTSRIQTCAHFYIAFNFGLLFITFDQSEYVSQDNPFCLATRCIRSWSVASLSLAYCYTRFLCCLGFEL